MAGTDAIHSKPVYSYAVCRLETGNSVEGIGLAFTLGTGKQLVCEAIDYLLRSVRGKEINELMAGFGTRYRQRADDTNRRWRGTLQGEVDVGVAAGGYGCIERRIKTRGVAVWREDRVM